MRKILLSFAAVLLSANLFAIGELLGRFTVNANGDQVVFSQGNLQYNAAEYSAYAWQFGAHQYDMIGAGNANISSTYDGWIDLFGWGTSGYDSDNYPPYKSSEDDNQYNPVGGASDIAGTGYDWGEMWPDHWIHFRTPTKDEWIYILQTRANAASKYGNATVAGVKGLILLPDEWTLPAGLSFTAAPMNWTTNTYTAEQWIQMEHAGAVFLPAGARRSGTTVQNTNEGYYWTSTSGINTKAYMVHFSETEAPTVVSEYRHYGCAVRVVKDYELTFPTLYTYNGITYRLDNYYSNVATVWNLACGYDPEEGPCYEGETPDGEPTIFSGNVVIPKKVPFNGDEYTVTGLAPGAFINSNITSIDMPSTLDNILQDAFKGCSQLQSITCRALELPGLGSYYTVGAHDCFEDYHFTNTTLYVNGSVVEKYRHVWTEEELEAAQKQGIYLPDWHHFNTILPIPGTEAIENTEVKSAANKYLKDGQLFLELNGKTYNAQGAGVK